MRGSHETEWWRRAIAVGTMVPMGIGLVACGSTEASAARQHNQTIEQTAPETKQATHHGTEPSHTPENQRGSEEGNQSPEQPVPPPGTVILNTAGNIRVFQPLELNPAMSQADRNHNKKETDQYYEKWFNGPLLKHAEKHSANPLSALINSKTVKKVEYHSDAATALLSGDPFSDQNGNTLDGHKITQVLNQFSTLLTEPLSVPNQTVGQELTHIYSKILKPGSALTQAEINKFIANKDGTGLYKASVRWMPALASDPELASILCDGVLESINNYVAENGSSEHAETASGTADAWMGLKLENVGQGIPADDGNFQLETGLSELAQVGNVFPVSTPTLASIASAIYINMSKNLLYGIPSGESYETLGELATADNNYVKGMKATVPNNSPQATVINKAELLKVNELPLDGNNGRLLALSWLVNESIDGDQGNFVQNLIYAPAPAEGGGSIALYGSRVEVPAGLFSK